MKKIIVVDSTYRAKGNCACIADKLAAEIPDAQVEVFRLFGQLRQVFYRGVTDQSGILQGIALPALPAAWSQSSDTADVSATDYQVTVRHPMFAPDVGRNAAVYARTETILPVALEPLL